MRRGLSIFLLTLVAWSLFPIPASQAAHPQDRTSPHGSTALCVPTLDLQGSGDCLHIGPVHYRYSMAKLGFTFPPMPLPARQPDLQLAVVPYRYARVVGKNAPVFGSAEDAARGENILYRLETGFDFITYIELAEINGGRIFMIAPGVWMRGSDLSAFQPPPLSRDWPFGKPQGMISAGCVTRLK